MRAGAMVSLQLRLAGGTAGRQDGRTAHIGGKATRVNSCCPFSHTWLNSHPTLATRNPVQQPPSPARPPQPSQPPQRPPGAPSPPRPPPAAGPPQPRPRQSPWQPERRPRRPRPPPGPHPAQRLPRAQPPRKRPPCRQQRSRGRSGQHQPPSPGPQWRRRRQSPWQPVRRAAKGGGQHALGEGGKPVLCIALPSPKGIPRDSSSLAQLRISPLRLQQKWQQPT